MFWICLLFMCVVLKLRYVMCVWLRLSRWCVSMYVDSWLLMLMFGIGRFGL